MNQLRLFGIIAITMCATAWQPAQAQSWQQKVQYTMNIDMDVQTNRFTGTQKLLYTNNSPDTLKQLFYHLYFNAFQPGSSMDVRSRELGRTMISGKPDWDSRVTDRISKLSPQEIGYQKIKSLKLNGVEQKFTIQGTILKVELTKPVLPASTVTLDMNFEGQVPLQIRRSGRDNPRTGVRYSMSQWYPKIAAYDREGWHADPYIAREFYAPFGSFDVTIKIDKNYKLGGTGIITNPTEIGWGYDKPGTPLKDISTPKRTWKFKADKVHDFVWAADPDYKHIVRTIPQGPVIHVLYKDPAGGNTFNPWDSLSLNIVKLWPFIEAKFGKYTYPQYSFIHGGDGGMEYPMATLIHSPYFGTAIHELMHNWYQGVIASNEALYPWMDEGFTSFAEEVVMSYFKNQPSIEDYKERVRNNPTNEYLKNMLTMLPEMHSGAYASYYGLEGSGLEEPLSTHADHYNTNYAYGVASYSKGEIFLEQLGYITGAETRDKILLEFYKKWQFKHPDYRDFLKQASDISGIQLDWYGQYWVNSTRSIDYGIDSVWEQNNKVMILLKREGLMPMPIDLEVNKTNGSKSIYNIPLNLMYGSKKSEWTNTNFAVLEPWDWVRPYYVVQLNAKISEIQSIIIDPSKRMADVNRLNNTRTKLH